MAKARTVQEINQDYFQTAATLGDLIWKVCKFTGEDMGSGQIADLKRKLRTIDNEMDEYQKLQAKEQEKTKLTSPKETPKMNGTTAPEEAPEISAGLDS